MLYYVGPKGGSQARKVVPKALRKLLLDNYPGGALSGHSSGPKLLKTVSRHWWWPGMHGDIMSHCKSCVQCTVVSASGRVHQPLLKPIPVQ